MNNHQEHQFVDLGLPSGTLWATCNVGAIRPEDFGNYYAWGEIAPKSIYNWNTYEYSSGGSYDFWGVFYLFLPNTAIFPITETATTASPMI